MKRRKKIDGHVLWQAALEYASSQNYRGRPTAIGKLVAWDHFDADFKSNVLVYICAALDGDIKQMHAVMAVTKAEQLP